MRRLGLALRPRCRLDLAAPRGDLLLTGDGLRPEVERAGIRIGQEGRPTGGASTQRLAACLGCERSRLGVSFVKYYLTGAGEPLEVEATETGVRIGDRELDARIETVAGSTRRHLRIGDRGVPLAAQRVDEGWVIQIGGRAVRLAVEDERTHAIRELAPGLGTGAPREVRAPMAGVVDRKSTV